MDLKLEFKKRKGYNKIRTQRRQVMSKNGSDTLYWTDAQFYDLDNRPALKADIPFYLDYAANIDGDILELACGTGRITIPLARAGHKVWALEYSEQMIRQFQNKLKVLTDNNAANIRLIHGDMSNLQLGRSFPLILLPARSFQLLLDEEKEISCLKSIHSHLEDYGTFIIAIANYINQVGPNWVSDEENFDWENTDSGSGYRVRRTHIKRKIDLQKQILYPQKIYRITKQDGSTEEVVRQAAWKYFSEMQIKKLLLSNGFEIIKEMGFFDGRPINEGSEFIFICHKKS
jgi:SAM-dependent methyltransferase